MEIYEVFEVEWPSRYINSPPHGLFLNFPAALTYLQGCTTPLYDRYMAIIRTRALKEWPPSPTEFFGDNILIYYEQVDGKFVEIETY